MVFRKQLNELGDYIDSNGVRHDVLHCERTESMELVQVGARGEVIDGEAVEVPIFEKQVVINKGWDEYPDIDSAAFAYGLTLQPLTDEAKLDIERNRE